VAKTRLGSSNGLVVGLIGSGDTLGDLGSQIKLTGLHIAPLGGKAILGSRCGKHQLIRFGNITVDYVSRDQRDWGSAVTVIGHSLTKGAEAPAAHYYAKQSITFFPGSIINVGARR